VKGREKLWEAFKLAGDADLVKAEATERRLRLSLSTTKHLLWPHQATRKHHHRPLTNHSPTKSLASSVVQHHTSPPSYSLPSSSPTSRRGDDQPPRRPPDRPFLSPPTPPSPLHLTHKPPANRASALEQSTWRASTPTSTSRCPGHTGTMTASTSAGESWRTTRLCAK
jgi:hypothetical protein